MTSKHTDKIIENFVLSRRGRFGFKDLAAELETGAGKPCNEKDVLHSLETGGLVFSRDLTTFMPRHVFFRKAVFMVSPTEEEAKEKILFPGHRFIPFCSRRVKPCDCVLKTKGGKVPLVSVKRRIKDVSVYFSLFGKEDFPVLLSEDNPANAQPLKEPDFMVRGAELSVFDFSRLFAEWKFKFGDGLLLTVEDWAEGIYSVEYISEKARKQRMKTARGWIEKMEKGFIKSFDDLGLDFPMAEQIAYGYFYAGKQVQKDPPIHLGGFIDSSAKIHFVDYGAETRLWHDAHLDSSRLGFTDSLEPSGVTGSIDAIFRDIGISLSEVEVEAYMRDELYHRREDPEAVLKRIFSGRTMQFYSEEQLEAFVKYFEKLWNRVKRSYNFFADQQAGKVRKKILLLLDRHLEWLRSLDDYDTDPGLLPVQEMTLAAQGTAFLSNYLILLNKKNPATEAEIREVLELLPQIDATLEALRVKIEDCLEPSETEGGKPTKNLRLVRPEIRPEKTAKEKKAKNIYVFKVGLQHIKPPVWRRIRVPGDFTLEELHDVLQIAMGWDNYHAHSFLVGSQYYSPAGEDGQTAEDEIDETSVVLDDLDLSTGQKFRYTYDFGDNWIHLVTVEDVIRFSNAAPAEKAGAVCLDGKRACPPEDSGGSFGYEEIIEALRSPNKKKHRERLDWLGDWAPEFFDIDAVNKRLRGEDL